MQRRALLASPLALPALAAAQSRAIRFIVPFAPGGTTDATARLLAEPLGERLGASVVVENRPGAGGNIGAEFAARSAPDGTTLLMGTPGAMTVNQHLYGNLNIDPLRDLMPVGRIFITDHAIVAHNGLPARNVAELVALARARPGEVSFGSAGTGATTHLFGEFFARRAGIRLTHVPYRGSGPAVADLLAGNIGLLFELLPTVAGHVEQGRLRGLATTGEARHPRTPAVPTLMELGLADSPWLTWNALMVPGPTPAPIARRTAEALNETLALPAIRERFTTMGLQSAPAPGEEMHAIMRRESAQWAALIREANIRLE
jgi:tripartite-type tricarboxylate transporter receptor subunit TctC